MSKKINVKVGEKTKKPTNIEPLGICIVLVNDNY